MSWLHGLSDFLNLNLVTSHSCPHRTISLQAAGGVNIGSLNKLHRTPENIMLPHVPCTWYLTWLFNGWIEQHSWRYTRTWLHSFSQQFGCSPSLAEIHYYQENVNSNKTLFFIIYGIPLLLNDKTVHNKEPIIPLKKDLIQSLHTCMDEQRKLFSPFNFWIAPQIM